MTSILDYIKLQLADNHYLKHEQITEGVIQAIKSKAAAKGDFLPSVNQAVEELGIARKTVVKAYEALKERGIIRAKKRLGYFIVDTNIMIQRKIMILLNHFGVYQQALYDSMLEKSSKEFDQIDLYFHHTNPKMFETIINSNIGQYTHYIISPFFDKKVEASLSLIPKDKLLLISRPDYYHKAVSYVIQNYTTELMKVLNQAKSALIKFDGLTLVLSETNKPPKELEKTTEKFCKKHELNYAVSHNFSSNMLHAGRAYFIIEDNDLLSLLMACKEEKWIPGKDIGVLSYNDSTMKQLLGNGISTVSVDFSEMGKHINHWLFDATKVNVVLPIVYHKRNSL